MILNIILILAVVVFLTILITLSIYSWINKEDKNVVEIRETLKLLSKDIMQLFKDVKVLSEFASDVAQPLLNPSTIDIESNEVSQDSNKGDIASTKEGTDENEATLEVMPPVQEDAVITTKEEFEQHEFSTFSKELEIENEGELNADMIKETKNKKQLEVAMAQWRAKGNEQLAVACAIALEELKDKGNEKIGIEGEE
tara:strand:+ start:65 stop:658 length:594 start_codon:yes stop_codon:yes gene_type:complete